MYTRRKVFSVANDYDYSDYYERLYSEAFEDGVNYAEKMFGTGLTAEQEKEWYDQMIRHGSTPEEAKAAIKGNAKNLEGEKEGLLKRIWKSKLGKAGVIATGAAGLGYGGYKFYKHRKAKQEAEAEKNYSEGFDDGVDYAIQKMFGSNMHQAELDEKEARNARGLGKGLVSFSPVAYLAGRGRVNKAIREGKSDDEVIEAADKPARISGKINKGILTTAGIAGGAAGTDALVRYALENPEKLSKKAKAVIAAGSLIGGAAGYGLGHAKQKISQLANRDNADEAIRRRKKVNEERKVDFR